MENLVEKINLILKTKNISARQFAEEIGVQPSGMSHILSGRNNPSLDFVMKVVRRYPEIDIKWLMFGQGEMLVKSATSTVAPATPAPVPPTHDSAPQNTQSNTKSTRSKSTNSSELNLFSQLDENPVNENAKATMPEYPILESSQSSQPLSNYSVPAIDPSVLAAAIAATTNPTNNKSKHIVRLLAFYDDHTFAEFLPE